MTPIAEDLIERAERYCAISISQAARTLIPELIEALKAAEAENARLRRNAPIR